MRSDQTQSIRLPAQAGGAAILLRSLGARLARKRLLAILLAVLTLLAIVPFLVPASLIVPRIESEAARALREPVRIGGARFYILPWPHVTLRDIAVGSQPFLNVAELKVVPRIGSLFGETRVLRSVALRGVTVRQPLFERLDRWRAAGGGGEPVVQVERIHLRSADLKLNSVNLDGIDADVRLAGNAVSAVQVRMQGGQVRLSLTPEGRDYAVKLSARNWLVPTTGVTVTAIEASGKLTAEAMQLPAVDGEFYGGSLAGHLVLSWKPAWRLAGQLQLRAVDLNPIAAAYSSKTAISGRLHADTGIDMRAESAAALAAAPNVAVNFEVSDGVLHGVDLVAAARLLPGKDEAKPGDTRFDRFTGHLLIDADGFHFSQLNIASGVLNAEGFLSISPARELSGKIVAAVKGTGSLVGTPLAVSGTVDSPRVLPTKGSLAGAAAGTMLLGPGVGTTLGMKAGELTERLFGKKAPKPKDPAAQGKAPQQRPSAPTTKPDAEAQAGRR